MFITAGVTKAVEDAFDVERKAESANDNRLAKDSRYHMSPVVSGVLGTAHSCPRPESATCASIITAS